MLPKNVRFAIAVILIHAVISAWHATAHVQLGVYLSFWPNVFVVVDIILLPLLAGLLLWRQLYTMGGWLLFLSMTGAFFFGLYYHFLFENPDHVAHVPASTWGMLFQLSATLVVLFEGIGAWAGWLCLAPPVSKVRLIDVEN